MEYPKIIILISGKRKCGKDFLAGKLLKIIGEEKCCILRISEPIKSTYAKENHLNLDELMSDNAYKENYRIAMINWSDSVRRKEPGYFCKATCLKAPNKYVWIVSDIRRKTDIKWFMENYKNKIKTVRIKADLDTRQNRNWRFTVGVDDVPSECDLDDYNKWDLEVKNNNQEEMNDALKLISNLITLDSI